MNIKKALLVLSIGADLALLSISATAAGACQRCEEALIACALEGKSWYECAQQTNWCTPC
ncbi:hypothetical protein SG34_019270 [Thalassomonas viridans]|uniref:Lipoprotein n=1 Tax=Thalassomonas viridans TaxID=137584 RepID=A0AAE9Z1J3_9GAMM|nr:hypothetical protein [Thalassomonas viridans]WDE03518.1 hypothetical protein SG34_019270 [Thalassomonas viridans]